MVWVDLSVVLTAKRSSLNFVHRAAANAKLRIVVRDVEKELTAERHAVKARVLGDPVLRRFFEVFLFEDLPASGRRADEVFLAEVDRCDVYVGLFGESYGFEDAAGVSATEREFDRATATGKERLVFVRGGSDEGRQPKMRTLIRKAGDQIVRRRFATVPEVLEWWGGSRAAQVPNKVAPDSEGGGRL